MKVKNLFLSMCAIAALASCSQNEDAPAPTGSDAPEAKVTLNLTGGKGEAGTRAVGNGEGTINDLTVFFFNSSGAIINGPQLLEGGALSTNPTLTTTTDATQVIVIANKNGATFEGISSISALKAKVVSLLGTTVVNNTPILQKKTSLTMSGWGKVAEKGNTGNYEANIQLHYIAAKIGKLTFTWTHAESAGKYGSWFTINKVYLMMAQGNSTLIATGATNTTWPNTGEVYTPTTFAYTGGIAWGQDGWINTPSPTPAVSSDYLQSGTFTPIGGNKVEIALTNPWYVFENGGPDHKTGVIIECDCQIKNDATGAIESKKRYFTVYFGEKSIDKIFGGQDYTINMKTSISFKPEDGTGGGGTPDPEKPTESSQVTVNVTAAQWENALEINKEFN